MPNVCASCASEDPDPARFYMACGAALAVDEPDRARRVAEAFGELPYPRERLFADTARAVVQAAEGDLGDALWKHADLAEWWAAYGHVWEEARAWLGVRRCGVALGRSEEAAAAEHRAASLLARLGVLTT